MDDEATGSNISWGQMMLTLADHRIRFGTNKALRFKARKELATWPDLRRAIVAGIDFLTRAEKEGDPKDTEMVGEAHQIIRVILAAQIAAGDLKALPPPAPVKHRKQPARTG